MKQLIYLLSIILIVSCSSNETHLDAENTEETASENTSINLSDEQVAIAKIETGKIITGIPKTGVRKADQQN